jgi:hypothetical protein
MLNSKFYINYKYLQILECFENITPLTCVQMYAVDLKRSSSQFPYFVRISNFHIRFVLISELPKFYSGVNIRCNLRKTMRLIITNSVCVCIYVCMRVWVCMNVYIYVCMSVCMNVCVYMYVCMYVCVCIICVRVYVYMYVCGIGLYG